MAKHKTKDPAKVRAGRMGGKVSGGNFKNNKDHASKAGRRSAWMRHSGKLADYPLEFEDHPIIVPKALKREARRARI